MQAKTQRRNFASLRWQSAILVAGLLAFSTASFSQPLLQFTQTNIGNSATATVAAPAGLQPGEILIAGLAYEKGSAELITPPAGWTLILRSDNSTECGFVTYYRITGAGEPSSYSFQLANGSKWSIGISRIVGAELSAPVEAVSSASGPGGSPTLPGFSPPGAGRLLLCFFTNKKNANFLPPSGTTEQYDAPNLSEGLPSNMLATLTTVGTAALGPLVAVPSESESWVAQRLLIRAPALLPLQLTNFSVARHNGDSRVSLRWTYTTTFPLTINVERSTDSQAWTTLAQLPISAQPMPVTRTYTDSNAPAVRTYYRLRLENAAGYRAFSAVREVAALETVLPVFPNPVGIRLYVPHGNPKSISLLNSAGVNLTGNIRLLPYAGGLYLALDGLPRGWYLLRAGSSTARFYKE
jgi:hypothetical protein